MSVIEGFFNFLGQLKDSSVGKIMIGLSTAVFGGLLLLANPDGFIYDSLFELIDRFDILWLLVIVVGLLILVVGIIELLREAKIIK